MDHGITLIIAGLLAAPSLVEGKSALMDKYLKMIKPYQGWVGVFLIIAGIINIIYVVLNIGWLTTMPVAWITYLAAAIFEFMLGILLAFKLINKHAIGNNPDLQEKGEMLNKQLTSNHKVIGLIAIGIGIWTFITQFIYKLG